MLFEFHAYHNLIHPNRHFSFSRAPLSFYGRLRVLKHAEQRVTLCATIYCFAHRHLLSSFPSFSNPTFSSDLFGENCSAMHLSSLFCLLLKFWSVLEFCNVVSPVFLGCMFVYCVRCRRIHTKMVGLGFGVFDFGSLLLVFFVAFGVGIRVSRSGRLIRFARKFVGKSRVYSQRTFSSEENGDQCSMDSDADADLGVDEFHEAKEDFEEEEVDEELSVTILREMVKAEKRKADAVLRDLEKERMAAASAVEEAMAMIFRLQNEKSALQIEVNQLQRWAEEKQSYDLEVIQSLEWNIMQYEEERSLLQDELKFCKNRLKVYEKDDETDTFDCIGTITPCTPCSSQSHFNGCKIDGLRIGSLDLGFADAQHVPD